MADPMSLGRGAMIVVEGLDRAGKSTQCINLVRNIEARGRKVRYMKFPDRTTPIGRMINSYLTGEAQQEDHVIHLLFSANRWEAAAQIKADVAAGTTVVVDRYCYSGCVYSAAKNVPGLDLVWARWPDVGLPRPDLCIFLDISPQDAASRGGYGQERYEREAMQLRVRQLFQELRTIYDRDDFHVIDGGRPLEEVEKAVLEAVLAKLDGHGHGGLTEELRSVQPVASPAAEPSRASK